MIAMQRRRSAFARFASRAWRRRLVVGAYAGYLAYLAALAVSHVDATHAWFHVLRPALFGLVAGCYFVLHRVTRETALRPDWALDERENRARADAYRTAYRILAAVLVPPIAYTLVAVDYPARLLAPVPREVLSEAFIFLVLLMLTLPTTVLAWTEPDPLPELDDEREPAVPAEPLAFHSPTP